MASVQGNLLHDVPVHAEGEVFTDLLAWPATGRVRIERIVSNGQASPPGFWYDSADDEWVLVISGSAEVEIDDGTMHTLGAGDWLQLPARCRHRVARTDAAQPTIWLAVHVTPTA
ncbi:cupin domain-containing protein [Cupriavidus pauculus]|uniref:cupin domain-containing protein n=1 Tax=Cupriavidus pauculus TaxID=82633 RepID=UPI001FD05B90|nr:cupin domain-containing protein [Cupriavidus pauculus]